MDIDTETLVETCRENNTLLEINSRHIKEVKDFVSYAVAKKARMVLSSDAHRPMDVGNVDAGLRLVEQIKIDKKLIMNIK